MATRNVGLRRSSLALGLLTLVLGSCTSPRLVLPDGAGAPLADYHDLFDAVIGPCRQVRTLELMLAIRGQTGGRSLRGRVRGALARPESLRLEGLAPFGAPGFVLVAGDQPAILLLPREQRVVTDATGQDLLDALTGLPLTPADFQAVITGCLVPDPRPLNARTYRNGWVGVELEGDATLYLQRLGDTPVMVAGRRPGFIIEYDDHARGLPRRVRVQTAVSGAVVTDLTATMSQVSINIELDGQAFVPVVPDGFVPMSVDALRSTDGPLAETRPLDR